MLKEYSDVILESDSLELVKLLSNPCGFLPENPLFNLLNHDAQLIHKFNNVHIAHCLGEANSGVGHLAKVAFLSGLGVSYLSAPPT